MSDYISLIDAEIERLKQKRKELLQDLPTKKKIINQSEWFRFKRSLSVFTNKDPI